MKVYYFSWVRERIGKSEETFTLPADIKTITPFLHWLAAQSTGHKEALKDIEKLRIAVNQKYAHEDRVIKDTDEIAIFPPVTGG